MKPKNKDELIIKLRQDKSKMYLIGLIAVFLSFFAGSYVVQDSFTIQDQCNYCNDVYGMSEGYCINEFVLLSDDKASEFCVMKGYRTGWLSSLTCDGGVSCSKNVFDEDGIKRSVLDCVRPDKTDFKLREESKNVS